MSNQLKLRWGLKEAWQQSRQTLHRWIHLTMASYGLLQLLTCINSAQVDLLCKHSPWRAKNPVTAGQIQKGLARILMQVPIGDWMGLTCKKFSIKNIPRYDASDGNLSKAA